MGIRVFSSKLFREITTEEEHSEFLAQFKDYKTTGVLPDEYGRDVPYHRPSAAVSAELQHLHLFDSDNPWSLNAIQFSRCSDIALVYCRGWSDPDCYLLITLLRENAHERARKITFMLELADIAEDFRGKF